MTQQPAARVGDPVAHTMAMPGALTGLLVGAAIGVAIVATGGLGAIAIGAAVATTGGLGMAGQYIGESVMGPPTGAIVVGSPDVHINDRPAARATLSLASCSKEYGVPQPEATGAASVYINGMPAGRKSEKIMCSAKIIEGSLDVLIGGPSVQTMAMNPEVPVWLSTTMQVMAIGGTIIATGGVAITYGVGAAVGGLAGGMIGGHYGGQLGGHLATSMGYGETGKRVGEVLGGIGGGVLGGGIGAKTGKMAGDRVWSNPRNSNQAMLRGGTQFRDTFNGRQAVARDFYKSQGFNEARTAAHMKGIDFTKPVEVVPLNSRTPLSQYQAPGNGQGSYYAPPGTPASRLGIAPDAFDPSVNAVVPKTRTDYVVGRNPVSVLRSTAAPVKDTWSIPGQSISTQGGGTQYFNTDTSSFIGI